MTLYLSFYSYLDLAFHNQDGVSIPSRLAVVYVLFAPFGVLERPVVVGHELLFVYFVLTTLKSTPFSLLVASFKIVGAACLMDYLFMRLLNTTVDEIVKATAEKEHAKLDAAKKALLAQAHDLRHFVQSAYCMWEGVESSDGCTVAEDAKVRFRACLASMRLCCDAYIFAASRGGQQDNEQAISVLDVARQLISTLENGSQFGNRSCVQTAVKPVAPLPPRLLLKPLAIQQMLVNALLNAFRFTESGLISVELEYSDEVLHIAVKDTGPGMTPEQIKGLTDLFATSSNGSNYGIGGVIMQQASGAHGGVMSIESTKGKGTTVSFSVPAREPPAGSAEQQAAPAVPSLPMGVIRELEPSATAPASPSPAFAQEDKLKLLIIDDCAGITDMVVMLVQRKLKSMVRHVEGVYSAAEALVLLERCNMCGQDGGVADDGSAETVTGTGSSEDAAPFDLVLTDLQMPRMNGVELIEAVRAKAAQWPEEQPAQHWKN